jgi:hypothetical protein
MPYYVILNFEDADATSAAGAIQRQAAAKPPTFGAAAAGTLGVYNQRADRKSKWYKAREAVSYSCQELIARDKNGTLSRADVQQIRTDCLSAKTIAIIIHGQPTDTEHGFSTGGAAVCDWTDLSNLALKLFPKDTKVYDVALIMCYGARSQDADLDHRGQIPANQLKTSFAYKFFRRICVFRNVRMSARTGAVSNDAALDHTVETEEQVFFVLDKQRAMAQRALNKPAMDLQKQALLAGGNPTPAQFDQMLLKFANEPWRPPVNATESFAKSYIIYSAYVNLFLQNQRANLGNMSKYGKLVYSYNGTLTITSRYDNGGGNGPNYQLYHGALL